jgi:hypothetical protein
MELGFHDLSVKGSAAGVWMFRKSMSCVAIVSIQFLYLSKDRLFRRTGMFSMAS